MNMTRTNAPEILGILRLAFDVIVACLCGEISISRLRPEPRAGAILP
jgi:hypothetical protein